MNTNEHPGKKKGLIFTSLFWVVFLTVSASAGELQKINFLPMWLPQPQFAGYYMAKEKGIYEKYGLNVTILKCGYNNDVASSLEQKEIHFGIMNLLSAIIKKEKGLNIVNVGQVFQRSAIEFVTRKDSGIDTLQDFNGKKIAVWRTRLQAQTQGFLKIHGIQAIVYPVDEGINFFLKKAVDVCSVMHYNGYNTLINYGINPDELKVFKLGQFNMDFPEDGIYCLAETYMVSPLLVRRFVDASMEGWDYAVKHPAETLSAIKKIRIDANLRVNQSNMQRMMDNMSEMIRPREKNTPMGHLAKSDYDHAVDFLLQTNEISQKVKYDEFYFNR